MSPRNGGTPPWFAFRPSLAIAQLRRPAKGREQAGVDEGDNAGDPRPAQGEHLHAVGPPDAILATAVNGEGWLAVGGGGNRDVKAGSGEDLGAEEPDDVVPATEPGRDRRH